MESTADGFGKEKPLVQVLRPGQSTTMGIGLPRARSASGRVLDARGNALGFVTVKAYQRGSRLLPTTTTDENGKFELDSLGPGPYHIVAYHPDGHSTRITGIRPPTQNLEIAFPD